MKIAITTLILAVSVNGYAQTSGTSGTTNPHNAPGTPGTGTLTNPSQRTLEQERTMNPNYDTAAREREARQKRMGQNNTEQEGQYNRNNNAVRPDTRTRVIENNQSAPNQPSQSK